MVGHLYEEKQEVDKLEHLEHLELEHLQLELQPALISRHVEEEVEEDLHPSHQMTWKNYHHREPLHPSTE